MVNKFKGMKKSNSDSKLGLGDRFSFTRRSKQQMGTKSFVNSPLPPRPAMGSVRGKTNRHETACEIICENIVIGPSIHSPRGDPDPFDNVHSKDPLLIKGSKNISILWLT